MSKPYAPFLPAPKRAGSFFRARSDGTFKAYQKRNGLPGNAIRAVVEDKNGNLWISTNKGLSRFDPATEKFRNFAKEDGLNSNEFYPRCGIQPAQENFTLEGRMASTPFILIIYAAMHIFPPSISPISRSMVSRCPSEQIAPRCKNISAPPRTLRCHTSRHLSPLILWR